MKFADTITVALAVLVAIVVLGPALARATEESADFMTQAALGMDAHPDAGNLRGPVHAATDKAAGGTTHGWFPRLPGNAMLIW